MARAGQPRWAKALGVVELSVRQLMIKYTGGTVICCRAVCRSCGCEFRYTKEYTDHRKERGVCPACAMRFNKPTTGVGPTTKYTLMSARERAIVSQFSPYRGEHRRGENTHPVAPHEYRVAAVRKHHSPLYGDLTVTVRR